MFMEVLGSLVRPPVFKTGAECEEHAGQVRFLCTSVSFTLERTGTRHG